MKKLSWAVTAGDQVGDSSDDQPCGDHFIDKDLECHDGDAHRPTPGKNPYWQGDRKGAGDKSKTPEKSGKNQPGHERDRDQQTPQHQDKQEHQERQGHTPESYAEDNVDHFADLMEKAYEDRTGQPLEWNDKRLKDLTEMVMRQTARQFPQDADDLGFHDSTMPEGQKGKKGRALWRPRHGERPTDFEREGGGKEHVPDSHGEGEGLYDKVLKQAKQGRTGGGGGEERRAESSLASNLTWGKIMQDRVQDQGIPCDDQAQARPCEEGEDPKIGKCNPNVAPEQRGGQARPPEQKPEGPAGKMSDQYRMHDKIKGPAKEGIGLQPGKDETRESRMSQHVDFLTQDDGMNHNQTANLMGNMMGGSKPIQQEDGSMLVGGPAASPQDAKQQNDDFRDTLTKSGWQNTSDMGGNSTWQKGRVALKLSLVNKGGRSGNQMKVVGPKPKPAPKKKGLFR